jgi:hypothetical protein
MYNLRYHIASLVAVFLALAIGLVLGTIVVERGALDQQRTSIVNSLQTDFTGLRTENAQLKKERDRDRAFGDDAVPALTTGMLEGRTIMLVTNAGRTDALPLTEQVLKDAGAQTLVVTVSKPGFGLDDQTVNKAVAAALTPSVSTTVTAEPVVAALTAEWAHAGVRQPVTDALRSSGVLSVEGTGTIGSEDGVVLLAAFDNASDPSLVSLVAGLHKGGRNAVGVELEAGAAGVAEASLAAGLSTVDAIDLPEGALSLVYVMAGKAEGHFGVKAGATSAYPALGTTQQ